MPILRRKRLTIGLLIAAALIAVVVVTVPAFQFEARVRGRLQQAGILPPPLPIYSAPNAPPDRVTARRLVVASLHDALALRDYEEAAMLNAILSQEAFQRADRALKAWEGARDPDTGLLPWALAPHYQEWDVGAIGANLFSHLLIASHYLDPNGVDVWEQILAYEREVCGPMPCSIEFHTGRVLEMEPDAQVRAASEYSRDGLLAVTERLGPGPWSERMVEVVDAILDASSVETSHGVIPFNSSEVNGSQLQALSRLYWATGDERYLEMAERIADIYLFDVLPNNRGLPADYWDFSGRRPLPEDARFRPPAEAISDRYPFRLSDHGGEIISGLTELYFLERMLDRPQTDRYRQPLQEFLDRLLSIGRTGEGLWVHSVLVDTLQPFDTRPSDTWGYNLVGFQTFDLAEGTHRYSDEIERMMRAVAGTHSLDWEEGRADGYADTVESMLYLLPWYDIPEAHRWVDDEIEVMFLKQRDDGFVEGWFLDGNFVRTALLYAQYKTQGLWLDPWSADVRLGAALDRDNGVLHIHIAAQQGWQGRLRFDEPRHRTIWGLPMEYPRVNGAPEWFVVEPEGVYRITDLETGNAVSLSAQELLEGLPLVLRGDAPRVVRLTVERQ